VLKYVVVVVVVSMFTTDREDTLHVLNTKKSANISLTSRNMVDQLVSQFI